MVSVIIPTYNREKVLARSIKSVLNQTYRDFELIIIDDGSTDNTETLVKQYQEKDKRILYYKQGNQGASAARNSGIELAKGEYIAFQDSDDEWLPNKLEVQMQRLQEKDADICLHLIARYIGKQKTGIYPPLKKSEMLSYRTIIGNGIVWTQMIVAKTKLVKENRFDPAVKLDVDYEWAVRACRDRKVWFENQILVNSYIQKDSISIGGPKRIKTREYFMQKYPDICRDYPEFVIYQMRGIGTQKAMLGMDDSSEYKKICEIRGNFTDYLKLIASKLRLRQLYFKIKNRR